MADAFFPNEPEILAARRPFPDAQAALEGGTLELRETLFSCGWYGSSISRERGCFALVNDTGGLSDLIGDRVRLMSGTRSVIVYVVGGGTFDYDIHLMRRAYAALSLLAVERIDVTVEVLAS